jgi:ATP-dependent Lon protease
MCSPGCRNVAPEVNVKLAGDLKVVGRPRVTHRVEEIDATTAGNRDERICIGELALELHLREKARHELKNLLGLSPTSPEATIVRNYLDWVLSIPRNKKTKINKVLTLAQEILDNDHCGLKKVKERVVEHLAVQQRLNKLTGPILCLVGPPGDNEVGDSGCAALVSGGGV